MGDNIAATFEIYSKEETSNKESYLRFVLCEVFKSGIIFDLWEFIV